MTTQNFKRLLRATRHLAALLAMTLLLPLSSAYATDSPGVKDKPLKLKPLTLENADGLAAITFGLGAQMQYDSTWANVGEANGNAMAHSHIFKFKRIRPSIKGYFFTKNLTYKLMIETVPDAVTLLDLFLDYKFHRHIRLRVGAHKPGFSRKRMNSWKNQQFVDFSNVPRYFGTERSLGLTLHNGYGKQTEHEYEFGIYGGVPWRPNTAKGITMISKEKMENPALLSGDATPYDEFHPELIGHYAFNFNGIDVSTETDWQRSDFRFSVGAGVAYDFRPQAFRDPAARTALEFMFKVRGLSFFGSFFSAFHDTKSGLDVSISPAFIGGFAQAGYKFKQPVELAVRYFGTTTFADFRQDAQANAAANVAADASLSDQYKGAGDLKLDQEMTFGFNYYPFGRHMKLATDVSYILKSYESKSDVGDVRWRLMMQFCI